MKRTFIQSSRNYITTKKTIGKLIEHVVMKRLSIYLFICLFSMNMVAQISPLVGTWEGTLSMEIPDPNSDGMRNWQTKIVIRIKQYGEDFMIRMKHVAVEDPSKVF